MKSEKCAACLRFGYVRFLLYVQIVASILFGATATKAQSSSLPEVLADSSGVLALTGTNMLTLKSWSDDELTILIGALGEVSTVPMSLMPTSRWGGITAGTYWSLQNPGMPPLPVNAVGVDVWPMSDGSFLLDDLDFEYGGFSAGRSMMSMDFPFPGGGTNFGTPEGLPTGNYDYGTNLWIAQTAVISNILTGIGTNTLADVQYEIQSRTNLAQTDWQIEGYIYGSATNNWTPLSVPRNNRTNLFLRLKSWGSSDGSGLPDWWQLLYFGTNGVDPNASPAGDGWSNIQKFQNGWNPNLFYTPAAPQGVTVSYNANNSTATVSWLSAFGAVTNYTVIDNFGHSADASAGATSVTFNLGGLHATNLVSSGPNMYQTYRVQADYLGGVSSRSGWVGLVYPDGSPALNLIPASNGMVLFQLSQQLCRLKQRRFD